MHKVLAHVLHVQNVHVAEIREYMYIYISGPWTFTYTCKIPKCSQRFYAIQATSIY